MDMVGRKGSELISKGAVIHWGWGPGKERFLVGGMEKDDDSVWGSRTLDSPIGGVRS